MPVLDTERRTASRSALRYRPIDTDQASPVPLVSRAQRTRPGARRTVAPAAPDHLDLEEEEERTPHRRRAGTPAQRQSAPLTHPKRSMHPLLFVVLGLVIALFLWIGISQAVRWGTNEYNTLVYGYPRTFQIDAVVGHGDSTQHPSHFLALNLRGTVTIIEFPAGDPGRARVLATTSLLGPNADQDVVKLAFIDINQNGRPDMLIDIDSVESVLINDKGTFRAPTPIEQQHILETLHQNSQ